MSTFQLSGRSRGDRHRRRTARSRRRRTGRGSRRRCPRAWCPRARRRPRTARAAPRGSAQRDGDRVAVAVGVGASTASVEKPEPAGLDRLVQQLDHRVELRRRRPRCRSTSVAHHVAAERAVPDEEAGVDADVAVEPVEVLAEGLPLPVDALLERGERHAFDLAPSSGGCSRRRSALSGASVNPQLPPMTVVTPCTFDGEPAGPRTAARRSGCAGRRTRAQRPARSASNVSRASSSMLARRRRCGRRARRRRRASRRAGAVDDGRAVIRWSSMTRFPLRSE